jgi:hypothetical protein
MFLGLPDPLDRGRYGYEDPDLHSDPYRTKMSRIPNTKYKPTLIIGFLKSLCWKLNPPHSPVTPHCVMFASLLVKFCKL